MLDKLIAFYAPHQCLGCRTEGKLLCSSCVLAATNAVQRCFNCQALSFNGQTCRPCRRRHELCNVAVAFEYSGLAKDLVYKLKFGGSRSAATAMARLMITPEKSKQDLLVLHLPTSTSRRRQRGFDQAQLLAKALAQQAGLPYCSALVRLGQSRQVGAGRQQRLTQLKDSFLVKRSGQVYGQRIILVDDVMTTGASLSAAAEALKQAGARRVEAAVFARA